jgi:hypothetical protein
MEASRQPVRPFDHARRRRGRGHRRVSLVHALGSRHADRRDAPVCAGGGHRNPSVVPAAWDAGIDMVFNTPNPKSGAGYLSMGWHEVGHIGVMVRPSRRLFRRAAGDRIPDLREAIVGASAVEHTGVTDRKPRGLRTPRTQQYLRWRFSRPQVEYGAIEAGDSIAVVRPGVRSGRTELVVSDVFGPQPAAALRKCAHSSRLSYLAGWFAAGSPERRGAIAAGMIPVPGVKTLRLVANPLRELPFDVTDLSVWDFATSDLELL